jgi:hypothetical protein
MDNSALRNSFKVGGIYLLVRDVKNPTPDRRQKYDWTAQPNWLAGTRFRIINVRINDDISLPAITTGKHQVDRFFLHKAPAELLAALEETRPTVHEVLRANDLEGFKDEILANLVSGGVVTIDQLIKAGESAAAEAFGEEAI